MRVFIIRHGETEYNVKDLCDSDPEIKVPLTEKGIEQAKQAAEKLKILNFDAIYSSEFFRAQETARMINELQEKHKKIHVDARLNDRKTGYQDKPTKEFHSALYASGELWRAKFNDGESFEEEKERVFSFLEELKNKSKYDTVLIVAHKEIIQITKQYFMKMSNDDAWKFEVENCQIMEFEFEK